MEIGLFCLQLFLFEFVFGVLQTHSIGSLIYALLGTKFTFKTTRK